MEQQNTVELLKYQYIDYGDYTQQIRKELTTIRDKNLKVFSFSYPRYDVKPFKLETAYGWKEKETDCTQKSTLGWLMLEIFNLGVIWGKRFEREKRRNKKRRL